MKLLKLTVENFRPFPGRHVLDLDVSDDKPAVLIIGMNGSGKTTLLNAFTWALYGVMSHDVEGQERIINDWVWSNTPFGEQVEASVKVEFEHDGTVVTVLREVSTARNSEEQQALGPELSVTKSRLGESESVINGQDYIEKVLPGGLRRFFFFNGERMERMFTGDGSDEVKEAIKTLLGLEAIERAIEQHLPAASRKLTNEAKKLGDGRLQKLIDEQEGLDKRQLSVHNQMLRASGNISGYKAEMDAAGKALLEHSAAAPKQKQRAKLQRSLSAEKEKYEELLARKKKILAEKGFLAFTGRVDQEVIDLAEAMRQRRQLPTGIQKVFIKELLEDGHCMCGAEVPEGTSGYLELTRRLENAGLQDVEERWLKLQGNAGRLAGERSTLVSELRQVSSDVQSVEASIDRIDAEISDIASQLEGVDEVNIQNLERRRKEFEDKYLEAKDSYRELEKKLEGVKEEISRTKRQFHSARAQNAEAQRLQRQVGLVNEVLEAFQRILDLKTEEVREELDAKVKDVFSRICIKPFTPELSPSFELELKAHTDGPAAIRSTGENQILGLSFVGAVSELARKAHERKQKEGGERLGDGGVYPVVMDAPFGNLDVEYQDQVAESLPKLTTQIVTFLSQSQSRGEVMNRLQGAASRMYVLRSVTSKADAREQSITINNRAVPYVTQGEFEHTVLEEVTV